MKTCIKFWMVSALLLTLWGCEKDPPEDENYRDKFTGNWVVVEKTGLNSPQSYSLQITAGNGQDQIIINGLYNNPAVVLNAQLYGLSFDIPTQSSDSITFSGSGQANVDFDQVTINFTANDGTGADHVKAILTPN